MTIYDYYNLAVDRTDISLAYESVEQDAISIEHFVSKINYLSMSHEGVKEKFKEIVKRFVEFLKKIGRFFKNIFDKIFRRNKANVESAIKNFQNPSRLVFKNVKNESDYNKLDDKDKTEFKKYIVSLKCFHWFAFGPSAEDIKGISGIIDFLNTKIDKLKNGNTEDRTPINDTIEHSKSDFTNLMSVFSDIRDFISGDEINKEITTKNTEGSDDTTKSLSNIINNAYGSGDKINFLNFYVSVIDGKEGSTKSAQTEKTLNGFMEIIKKIDTISNSLSGLVDPVKGSDKLLKDFMKYVFAISKIITRIGADVSFFVTKTRDIHVSMDHMDALPKDVISTGDRILKEYERNNKDASSIRNGLCTFLTLDKTGRKYDQLLKYLKKNGISEDDIYEEHDGKELSDEPTDDNYAKLWAGLRTNFSKERVMMRIKVGRKLYPSEM